MKRFKIHPLAECYPVIAGMASSEFKKSIEKNGQQIPIVVMGNEILDGRCRYEECLALGIEPKTIPYEGPTDLQSLSNFVEAVNDHRRHLSIGQRAMAEANRNKYISSQNGDCCSNKEAAEKAGVSERTMVMAEKVVEFGATELVEAVVMDEVSVSDAAAVVELPKAQQVKALKKVRDGKAPTVRKAVTFDTDEFEAKKPKPGRQRTKPADRKEAIAALSKLIRVLDRMRISADVDGALKAINQAIKNS